MKARPWLPLCPAYLNALTGKGVHVVTVNDYLAKRDSGVDGQGLPLTWALPLGLIIPGMDPTSAGRGYAADITYCTNNELGFDYLGTTWPFTSPELVQRGHAFAIVDEVDSILIDEARTP